MKPKLNTKLWFGIAALLLSGLAAFLSLPQAGPEAAGPLSEQELAQMVKPSVVRIINHASGLVSVPDFSIDLPNQKLNFSQPQTFQTEKMDVYISGSGFVVTPEGHILTNAHVATEASLKESYLEEALLGRLEAEAGTLEGEQLEKYFPEEGQLEKFYEESMAELRQRAQFKISGELTVLNPSDSQEYIKSLIKSGFSAEIVSSNPNFAEDGKDIALIKIQAERLPSLSLGASREASMGDRIFVFGFPSTAETGGRSPLEATLTQGLISAIKFSQTKEFKILQTDAKISQGSSGGPLLNQKGEVVGIVTFQTGESVRQKGDNFAFALPAELASQVLAKNGIQNQPGEYAGIYRQALEFYKKNQCRDALATFQKAAELNPNFTGRNFYESYSKSCEAKILEGRSLDSLLEKTWNWLKNISAFAWFVILGRILLVLAAMLALEKLYLRLKKDEQQIEALEIELKAEEERKSRIIGELEKSGTPLPLPEPEMHARSRLALNLPHPHLAEFVKQGRESGLKDEEIRLEFLRAGWPEEEINQAFSDSQNALS